VRNPLGSGFRVRGSGGKLFIISGPSGSGKTTLLEHLLKDKVLKGKLKKSVSITTRPKRSGERQGRDYYFLSEADFQRALKAKKILEWTKYLGYYYATPKVPLRQQLKIGRHLGLCLDFKGAKKIKSFFPKETVTIFILPPCLDTLKKRIRGRCHKTGDEEIQKRLKLARQELAAAGWYDYSLVNKHLPQTVDALKGIILAEIKRRV